MLPSCSMWCALSHVLSLQLIAAIKLLCLWPELRWLQRKAFPLVSFCWHHVWSQWRTLFILRPYLQDPQGLTPLACADCILMHDTVFDFRVLEDGGQPLSPSTHPVQCICDLFNPWPAVAHHDRLWEDERWVWGSGAVFWVYRNRPASALPSAGDFREVHP